VAFSRSRWSERLIEIGDDVVDVLDADAEPDHLRPHAGLGCSSRRHLPMRRRGRMAGERLGVAHIDQPLEQLERVVERLAGLKPPAMPKVSSEQARPPRYFCASA
jgi:hypothetical protein